MKTILPLLVFIFLVRMDAFSCTAFCLKNQESIILAKNLDWESDRGYVMVNPSGIHKKSLSEEGKAIEWTSRYSSLTFNQFGKEFPLGGMNSCGLAVEELNTVPVDCYPYPGLGQLNEFQIVQFLLDHCASVAEAMAWVEKLQQVPVFQPLHYLMADSSGVCAVIEFDGHRFVLTLCTGSDYPVLSNNRYSESLQYLSRFEGYGGELPVVNRPGSNERFVYAVELLNGFSTQNPVDYSFHVLDCVKQEDTRWNIIYDLKNLKVYFRFHACNQMKVFDFSLVENLSLEQTLGCNLADCSCSDIADLKVISPEENEGLLKDVSREMDPRFQKVLFEMAAFGNFYLRNASGTIFE